MNKKELTICSIFMFCMGSGTVKACLTFAMAFFGGK